MSVDQPSEKAITVLDIPDAGAKGKPVSACGYFDKLQVWVQHPVTKAERELLYSNCGNGAHIDVSRRARWDASYQARLSLYQPNQAVLEWIVSRPDALINQVE